MVRKGRYVHRSRTERPLRKVESASVSEIRIRINSTRSPSISRRPNLALTALRSKQAYSLSLEKQTMLSRPNAYPAHVCKACGQEILRSEMETPTLLSGVVQCPAWVDQEPSTLRFVRQRARTPLCVQPASPSRACVGIGDTLLMVARTNSEMRRDLSSARATR